MPFIQDFMGGFSLTGQTCTICGENAIQRIFRESTVGWEYRCAKHGLLSFASQDIQDELADLRTQVEQMREAIELYESIYCYFVSLKNIPNEYRQATLEMHATIRHILYAQSSKPKPEAVDELRGE